MAIASFEGKRGEHLNPIEDRLLDDGSGLFWGAASPFGGNEPAPAEAEKCPYDPSGLVGAPLGMFHCPICSEMVIAGMPHPDYSVDEYGNEPDPREDEPSGEGDTPTEEFPDPWTPDGDEEEDSDSDDGPPPHCSNCGDGGCHACGQGVT